MREPSIAMTSRQGRGITRDRIAEAALHLLDQEGLGGLTMRRLADRLGIQAMSLYEHVSNKDEILDLVVLRVRSEVILRDPAGGWRVAVETGYRSYRDALLRHPNSVELAHRRPVSDADAAPVPIWDWVLRCFRLAGLGARDAVDAHRACHGFTVGSVLNQVSVGRDGTVPAPQDGRDRPYFDAAAAYLESPDFDRAFEFGLAALLDSFARAGSGRSSRR